MADSWTLSCFLGDQRCHNHKTQSRWCAVKHLLVFISLRSDILDPGFFFFLQWMDFYDSLQAKDRLKKQLVKMNKLDWKSVCLCCGQCKYLNTWHKHTCNMHTKQDKNHRGETLIISSTQCPQVCGTKQDQKPWIRRKWVHPADA